MINRLKNAIGACLEGHCAFVDITYTEVCKTADYLDATILWCRHCGKIEIYVTTPDDMTKRVVELNPKVSKIVREEFDG